MFFKIIFAVLVFTCTDMAWSQQRIEDFYLSNYKDNGSKEWEVKGKEAIVSEKYVDITDMEGTSFQEKDVIDIEADKARLDKENMDVYLEDNVKIRSKQGIKMNTDFLDWKQSANLVTTDNDVEVIKENSLRVQAKGLRGDTELKNVSFLKEVNADMFDNGEVINIICDGPLEIDYNDGKAVFNNNVVVDNVQGKMFSKKATIYFDAKAKSIIKMVAEGDVKIIKDDNVSFSDRAIYTEETGKMILEGRPRLVIFPKDDSGLKIFGK